MLVNKNVHSDNKEIVAKLQGMNLMEWDKIINALTSQEDFWKAMGMQLHLGLMKNGILCILGGSKL